jgi:hypothetical protein
MTCCEPIIKNFTNESITTIPYGEAERAIYGEYPSIDIVYFNAPSDWLFGGVFTEVKKIYTPSTIRIEHGGPATGYAKIG